VPSAQCRFVARNSACAQTKVSNFKSHKESNMHWNHIAVRTCGRILSLGMAAALLASAQPPGIDPNHQRVSDDHFRARAAEYGLKDATQELKVTRGSKDEGGVSHIRYQQFFKGVRVFEGEAISHVDPQLNVTVTSSLRPNLTLDVTPAIPQGVAVATAVKELKIKGPHNPPSVALEILPKGERSPVDRLTWHVTIPVENDTDEPAVWETFVDARSGIVVWRFNALENSAALATGKTMYTGNRTLNVDYQPIVFGSFLIPRYYTRDLTRGLVGGGNYTVNMNSSTIGSGSLFVSSTPSFGNNLKDNSNPATAGADAHFGVQSTWDYFKFRHVRNGVDDLGTRTHARVHYGLNIENAYWDASCFCLKLGDGLSKFYPLVSLDVIGHEFAHGVMRAEANLTYSGESGGLNEASSDIFGTMVEYYVNSAVDVPDYWIGERAIRANWAFGFYFQTKALRYMNDPHKDGISPACWSPGLGAMDVHYSSGPANHMFYLLAEGGTSKCNGNFVGGIGRINAAKIWYKAVRDHMTSSTNYAGARSACLISAALQFGFLSPQYLAVQNAFKAINVP
jgi:zinc metalloprotease ZmpA